QAVRGKTDRRTLRTVHQWRGIRRENLVIVVVGVVEDQVESCKPVIAGDCRGVDLGNAGVEPAVSGANHQRLLLPDGVSEADARRKVVGIEWNLAGGRPERIRGQALGRKRLQVVAQAEADRQAGSNAYRILQESREFIG